MALDTLRDDIRRRERRRTRLAAAGLALLLCAPASAAAQAPPPTAGAPAAGAPAPGAPAPGAPAPPKGPAQLAADKRTAQKLLAQGNQLLGEGDYVGALDKFRAAYDKFPSPKLLLNIGTTLRQLGRNVEAAEVYEKYLRDPERDAAREKEVKRVLEEIDVLVGRLIITVDDPAASVRIDGKAIDNFVNGESRRVDLGEHQITAVRTGTPPVVQNVTVRAHQEYHLALQFAATAAPPPPPPPASGTQRTIALVFGGVGALTLVAGIVSGIVAVVQNGDAGAHCYHGGIVCGPQGVDDGRAAKTSATISTIGFVAGLGFLGTGTLIYVLAPAGSGPRLPFGLGAATPQKGPSLASVKPWVSVSPLPSGAAVSFGGVF